MLVSLHSQQKPFVGRQEIYLRRPRRLLLWLHTLGSDMIVPILID
jgi:hypothetical protein